LSEIIETTQIYRAKHEVYKHGAKCGQNVKKNMQFIDVFKSGIFWVTLNKSQNFSGTFFLDLKSLQHGFTQ